MNAQDRNPAALSPKEVEQLQGRITQLEGQVRGLVRANLALFTENDSLKRHRTDLQIANNAYLERARLAERSSVKITIGATRAEKMMLAILGFVLGLIAGILLAMGHLAATGTGEL
ncbi:hypothetical protein J2X65_003558 [Ancylobacter sp. 3268]|uniref:hypothetical protein n=1 Tax=Ancylobacter sp. 3268 TaxID=2817752 RepID=UPI0028639E78|nr:hypothetical protein [Ancylobacter sp. 3268]MDR6954190.1 hypothetical protein [Ancylobacter sp. 3268]